MCGVPATKCSNWKASPGAHCNAHRKSLEWLQLWNSRKSPLLHRLTLEETTQEIRDAARITEEMRFKINREYENYKGRSLQRQPCPCLCHTGNAQGSAENCTVCKENICNSQLVTKDFDNVTKVIKNELAEVNAIFSSGRSTTALIMLDGILDMTFKVKQLLFSRNGQLRSTHLGKGFLYNAIDDLLIDLFMQDSVPTYLRRKTIENMKGNSMLSLDKLAWQRFISLTMRHWDDSLLSPVLHGQNITGKRGNDVLRETLTVAKKRLKILEDQKKWQQAIRYLKLTQITSSPSSNSAISKVVDLALRSKLPMYYILSGKPEEAYKLLLQENPGGRKTQTAKNSNSLLKAMAPSEVLSILKTFSGQTVLTADTPVNSKPLEVGKQFLLSLTALIINPANFLSVEMIRWVKYRFLNEIMAEPQPDEYNTYRCMTVVLLADIKNCLELHCKVPNTPSGKAVILLSMFAEWTGRKDIMPSLHTIIPEYRSLCENNPWLFRHLLNDPSILYNIQNAKVFDLLKNGYVSQHGLAGLWDSTIQVMFSNLTVMLACELLEEVLKQSVKSKFTKQGLKQGDFIRIDFQDVPETTSRTVYQIAIDLFRRNYAALSCEKTLYLNYKTIARFLRLLRPLMPLCSQEDELKLINLALKKFQAHPEPETLNTIRAFSGTNWQQLQMKCLQILDNLVSRGKAGDQCEMVEMFCFLGGYNRLHNYLWTSQCREYCSPSTSCQRPPFPRIKANIIAKISSLIRRSSEDEAKVFVNASLEWLSAESYRPLLCSGICNSMVLPEVVTLWAEICAKNVDLLVQILRDSTESLTKALESFYAFYQDRIGNILRWFKIIHAVFEKANKSGEFERILSPLRRSQSLETSYLCRNLNILFPEQEKSSAYSAVSPATMTVTNNSNKALSSENTGAINSKSTSLSLSSVQPWQNQCLNTPVSLPMNPSVPCTSATTSQPLQINTQQTMPGLPSRPQIQQKAGTRAWEGNRHGFTSTNSQYAPTTTSSPHVSTHGLPVISHVTSLSPDVRIGGSHYKPDTVIHSSGQSSPHVQPRTVQVQNTAPTVAVAAQQPQNSNMYWRQQSSQVGTTQQYGHQNSFAGRPASQSVYSYNDGAQPFNEMPYQYSQLRTHPATSNQQLPHGYNTVARQPLPQHSYMPSTIPSTASVNTMTPVTGATRPVNTNNNEQPTIRASTWQPPAFQHTTIPTTLNSTPTNSVRGHEFQNQHQTSNKIRINELGNLIANVIQQKINNRSQDSENFSTVSTSHGSSMLTPAIPSRMVNINRVDRQAGIPAGANREVESMHNKQTSNAAHQPGSSRDPVCSGMVQSSQNDVTSTVTSMVHTETMQRQCIDIENTATPTLTSRPSETRVREITQKDIHSNDQVDGTTRIAKNSPKSVSSHPDSSSRRQENKDQPDPEKSPSTMTSQFGSDKLMPPASDEICQTKKQPCYSAASMICKICNGCKSTSSSRQGNTLKYFVSNDKSGGDSATKERFPCKCAKVSQVSPRQTRSKKRKLEQPKNQLPMEKYFCPRKTMGSQSQEENMQLEVQKDVEKDRKNKENICGKFTIPKGLKVPADFVTNRYALVSVQKLSQKTLQQHTMRNRRC
ncbi:uncharacterized protein [Ptychodera flava]